MAAEQFCPYGSRLVQITEEGYRLSDIPKDFTDEDLRYLYSAKSLRMVCTIECYFVHVNMP